MAHSNVLISKVEGENHFEINFHHVDINHVPSEPQFISLNYDELTVEEKAVYDNFKTLAESKAV